MRKMRHGAFVVALLLLTGVLQAQQPASMSDCFPLMLQQHRSFNSLTQFELNYLSTITEDDWKAHQQQAGGAIFGIAAASWADFETERKQIFDQKRLDISYYQNLAMSSVTLDPAAYDVMKACIAAEAQTNQKGLTYVAVSDDVENLSIRFFWNPTNPPYVLKASGMIDNGYNIDPVVRRGNLFAGYIFTSGEIFNTGPTLQLKRLKSDQAVRITLKTDPEEVGHNAIIIAPYVATPHYKTVWVIRTLEETVDPERFKTGEENYNSVYEYSKDVGGPVIYTSASLPAAYYHMEQCSPNGNSFHIRADKQRSDNRTNWRITIRYLAPVERCDKDCGAPPSPYPDEDDPNNYSFNQQSVLSNPDVTCTWAAKKRS